ncbi:MAG: ATP-dependent sacrificial sulfur transferase LarE, partial [Desulfobacteraceae bacterium]|nr:ATP-dependent sacrificial sulfur transferase LarE [Desulfobacteraceae bacterium]
GGIDSSLVAKVAYQELKDKAVAITLDSDVFPRKDLVFSKKIAKEIGIKHIILKASKLADPAFIVNSEDRCYQCKNGEIELIEKTALEHGIKHIAYGVNTSDQNEHRPGIEALKEANIFFPLLKAGIGKPVIPQIAKQLGLSNWDMPSTTCLASRIPYGSEIDKEKLAQIEGAENFISDFGVSDSRVRHHGDIARIEVPENEIDKIAANRAEIVKKLQTIGFKYIALDLQGYRSGSMNEVI